MDPGSDLLTPLSLRFRTSAGRQGKWLCGGDWSYSLSKQIISSQLTYVYNRYEPGE